MPGVISPLDTSGGFDEPRTSQPSAVYDPSRFVGFFTYLTTPVVMPASGGQLCQANPNRVGLYLRNCVANPIAVGIAAGQSLTTANFDLPASSTISFTWGADGALVTLGFWGYTTGPGWNFVVTEVIFRPTWRV